MDGTGHLMSRECEDLSKPMPSAQARLLEGTQMPGDGACLFVSSCYQFVSCKDRAGPVSSDDLLVLFSKELLPTTLLVQGIMIYRRKTGR
jgi:hypothetical protein